MSVNADILFHSDKENLEVSQKQTDDLKDTVFVELCPVRQTFHIGLGARVSSGIQGRLKITADIGASVRFTWPSEVSSPGTHEPSPHHSSSAESSRFTQRPDGKGRSTWAVVFAKHSRTDASPLCD